MIILQFFERSKWSPPARDAWFLIPHSFFCEKVFTGTPHTRGTNESKWGEYSDFWLAFFPPSPPVSLGFVFMGSCIQLQQRNCFRFSRNSSRPLTFLNLFDW